MGGADEGSRIVFDAVRCQRCRSALRLLYSTLVTLIEIEYCQLSLTNDGQQFIKLDMPLSNLLESMLW